MDTSIVRLNLANQIHELAIKEYKGHRIVTFKDIDTLHHRPDGTAGRNFRENRFNKDGTPRFIDGEEFFEINQPDEIRRLGFERPQGGTPAKAIVMTESGYLMLVKSLNDDLAWQVQKQLVKHYFRGKANNKRNSLPYLDHLGKALREEAKLSKDLSKPNRLRSKAITLRQLQEQTGHDYSEQIRLLEADADSQEKLIEARAAQKQAEAKAKQRKKLPALQEDMVTRHTKATLDWIRTEHIVRGNEIAILHNARLLVMTRPLREWAMAEGIDLTAVLKHLAKLDMIETGKASGKVTYVKRPLRVNGGNAPKAVCFKAGCFDWLTSTVEQAQ